MFQLNFGDLSPVLADICTVSVTVCFVYCTYLTFLCGTLCGFPSVRVISLLDCDCMHVHPILPTGLRNALLSLTVFTPSKSP